MKRVTAAFVAMAMAVGAAGMAAQDATPLNAAKDLYALARYDEALTVLNALRGGNQTDTKAVEQYRSLCLLALGRAEEAESAIAAVITADPLYQPGESEASPRVRGTFTDVRRRLLPEIVTARYIAAKGAFDAQQWVDAETQFRLVLALIDDPDTGGRLADLRVLTTGFLELSARAAAPPPPPPAPEPAPEAPPAVPEPEPVPSVPEPGRIYEVDEEGVVAAAVIRQNIPSVPAILLSTARSRGLLEVVIDEEGRPVTLAIRSSIHPTYDNQVLLAARDWQYRPATFNGHPVKFRKLIQIAVQK